MANRLTRLMILALTVCPAVWAFPKQKGAAPQSPSESIIRRAIIRELGDPREWGGDGKINFVSARADLNNDGRPETLVWAPTISYGGTSGYPLLIFSGEGSRLRLMAKMEQVWTPLLVLDSPRRGWRDIVVQVGGGGERMRYVVYRHDGRVYPDNFKEIRAGRIRGRQLLGKDWQATVMGPLPAKR